MNQFIKKVKISNTNSLFKIRFILPFKNDNLARK